MRISRLKPNIALLLSCLLSVDIFAGEQRKMVQVFLNKMDKAYTAHDISGYMNMVDDNIMYRVVKTHIRSKIRIKPLLILKGHIRYKKYIVSQFEYFIPGKTSVEVQSMSVSKGTLDGKIYVVRNVVYKNSYKTQENAVFERKIYATEIIIVSANVKKFKVLKISADWKIGG